MIAGIFHQGSGLGNQLHRYVATRVLALDKGYDFSMVAPELFKGKSFMNLNMGMPFNETYRIDKRNGKVEATFDVINGSKNSYWHEGTNYYNPKFNFIEDNTIIDGEFQDERYFEHRLKEIDKWLHVEQIDFAPNVCIINFRGGEYKYFPELYLTKEYWDNAIEIMRQEREDMVFVVVTDDEEEAKKFFPDFMITHEIGRDWRSIRYAPYLILANSSFAILPALLNDKANKIIAPKFWARRNTGEWSMPQNFYKKFLYV